MDEFVIDTWVTLKDFVPLKQRDEAAYQYIKLVDESGMINNLHDISGHDVYLDKVIAELVGEAEDLNDLDELEFEE